MSGLHGDNVLGSLTLKIHTIMVPLYYGGEDDDDDDE